MLNHAAYVNHENVERKVKAKRNKDGGGDYDYYQEFQEIERDPVVMAGKKMSELSPEEMEQYLTQGFG